MMDYKFKVVLSYDLKVREGVIDGSGGRAILGINSSARCMDFGVCRKSRNYDKEITLYNSGVDGGWCC